MEFFYNDVYGNQGFYNTRTITIPEADDREALAENKESAVKAKTSPASKKNIFLALGVFVAIAFILGVLK